MAGWQVQITCRQARNGRGVANSRGLNRLRFYRADTAEAGARRHQENSTCLSEELAVNITRSSG